MDILTEPITSRKDFIRIFSNSKSDKETLKKEFKDLKVALSASKPKVGI